MRIAATSEGNTPESQLAEHFGRCPFFIVFETDGKQITSQKTVENPYFNNHVPGAVPKFIKSLDADLVLTGGIGPMAIEAFKSMSIEVIYGIEGTCRKAAEDYLSGKLKGDENPCTH